MVKLILVSTLSFNIEPLHQPVSASEHRIDVRQKLFAQRPL